MSQSHQFTLDIGGAKESKMGILEWNRRILRIFGMCSLENGFWLRLAQSASVAFILLNFWSLEWFSALYLADHYRIGDIDRNLFVVIQVFGTFPSFASFISLVYRRRNVCEYFDQMQQIYNRCEREIGN